MHLIYSLINLVLLPFILIYTLVNIHSDEKSKIFERLGFIKHSADIWLHAASVGEVKAACLLIKKIKTTKPELRVTVSTMTRTGKQELERQLADSVKHFYLGIDLGFIWRKILNKIQPEILIIMEQEIWPNLIYTCQRLRVKTYLVNARCSEKSLKNQLQIFRKIYKEFDFITTQSEQDRINFINLGTNPANCQYFGNIKFDLKLDSKTKARAEKIKTQIGSRPVWIAGSTHKGEDEIILRIHHEIVKLIPNALLILAPRHFERTGEIEKLLKAKFIFQKASKGQKPDHKINVLLLDTHGELLSYYGAADLALVAGSLLPEYKGHNLLEPAIFAKPVLSGEHLAEFRQIKHLLLKAKALTLIRSEHDGFSKILELLQNRNLREQLGQRALEVIRANQGASEKTASLIIKHWEC